MRIQRERAFAVLMMINAMLLVLHLLTRVMTWRGEQIVKRHEFLDLGAEISLPTWWQQSQLLAAAALCCLIGVTVDEGSRVRRRWMVLAGIFLYISLDEGTQLHEGLIGPMQRLFDIDGGVLTFAWVIPGAAAIAVFVAVYLRFWWSLPRHPRVLMGVAGVLTVVGALGVEMAGGWYRSERGADRGYEALVALEEGLEMVGISVFVLSLLTVLQLRQTPAGVPVRVEGKSRRTDRATHEAVGTGRRVRTRTDANAS